MNVEHDARVATMGQPQWRQAVTADGRVYFYDVVSKATAWQLPPGAAIAGGAVLASPAPVAAGQGQVQHGGAGGHGTAHAAYPLQGAGGRASGQGGGQESGAAVQPVASKRWGTKLGARGAAVQPSAAVTASRVVASTSAALPPDWHEYRDPSGRPYYHNVKTGMSSWTAPSTVAVGADSGGASAAREHNEAEVRRRIEAAERKSRDVKAFWSVLDEYAFRAEINQSGPGMRLTAQERCIPLGMPFEAATLVLAREARLAGLTTLSVASVRKEVYVQWQTDRKKQKATLEMLRLPFYKALCGIMPIIVERCLSFDVLVYLVKRSTAASVGAESASADGASSAPASHEEVGVPLTADERSVIMDVISADEIVARRWFAHVRMEGLRSWDKRRGQLQHDVARVMEDAQWDPSGVECGSEASEEMCVKISKQGIENIRSHAKLGEWIASVLSSGKDLERIVSRQRDDDVDKVRSQARLPQPRKSIVPLRVPLLDDVIRTMAAGAGERLSPVSNWNAICDVVRSRLNRVIAVCFNLDDMTVRGQDGASSTSSHPTGCKEGNKACVEVVQKEDGRWIMCQFYAPTLIDDLTIAQCWRDSESSLRLCTGLRLAEMAQLKKARKHDVRSSRATIAGIHDYSVAPDEYALANAYVFGEPRACWPLMQRLARDEIRLALLFLAGYFPGLDSTMTIPSDKSMRPSASLHSTKGPVVGGMYLKSFGPYSFYVGDDGTTDPSRYFECPPLICAHSRWSAQQHHADGASLLQRSGAELGCMGVCRLLQELVSFRAFVGGEGLNGSTPREMFDDVVSMMNAAYRSERDVFMRILSTAMKGGKDKRALEITQSSVPVDVYTHLRCDPEFARLTFSNRLLLCDDGLRDVKSKMRLLRGA